MPSSTFLKPFWLIENSLYPCYIAKSLFLKEVFYECCPKSAITDFGRSQDVMDGGFFWCTLKVKEHLCQILASYQFSPGFYGFSTKSTALKLNIKNIKMKPPVALFEKKSKKLFLLLKSRKSRSYQQLYVVCIRRKT